MMFHYRFFFLIAAMTLVHGGADLAAQSKVGPNVLLVIARGIGPGDIGSGEERKVKTPNLSKLMEQGTRFDRFYLNSVDEEENFHALMTGSYPKGGAEGEDAASRNNRGLGNVFKGKGHRTAFIGCWQGGPLGHPTGRYFDEFFGANGRSEAEDPYPIFVHRNERKFEIYENRSKFREKKYVEDMYLNACLNFIRINQPIRQFPDRRWFLAYAPFFTGPAEGLAERTGNGFVKHGISEFDPEKWAQSEKNKADQIRRLDRFMGQLMDRVARTEIPGKTAVVLVTVSGAHNDGGTKASLLGSQGKHLGEKGTLFEGALRVPAIVWWPEQVGAGSYGHPVSLANVHSVLAGWSGTGAVQGTAPSLFKKEQKNALIWNHHGEGPHSQAIVDGKWKLIVEKPSGQRRLYDLESDQDETLDRSGEQPVVLERLTQRLKASQSED